MLFALLPLPIEGQETHTPTGWEVTGIPALNYDSDEGFGYGVILALYDYGPLGVLPYRTNLQPTLFFTTEGRRDLTVFFDAPHVGGEWRLDAFLGLEKQIATPYYGAGNETPYDPALEEGSDPYFYRYGRERKVLRLNLQRPLGDLPVRLLVGAQVAHFKIDPTPKNEGNTLLLQELGPGATLPGGYGNSLRGGLVWDTRDRESGPGSGVWTAALVEWVPEALGSDSSYTRWTLTDRRYFTLAEGMVFANRFTLQNVTGDPPFYALTYVQSSFGETEALGGAKSVRGVLRNRYFGEGLFFWNLELRWRAWEFGALGREAHLALIGFMDTGRVWENGLELGSLLTNLHTGAGGGIRFGLGPNFVIATDVASSGETGLQFYIGLGYLF
ncbi:MAG: Omp85 family outer membrane protein [Longimicrobiales bacterium]